MSIRSVDVAVAGVRSPVRSGGPEDPSEAVVFVHGNPGSSEDFADLLEHVSEFARVLAPDMPGYGKADRPGDTVGDEVSHNGLDYRCRQSHTSQTGWEPPNTYALWERINTGGQWAPQVIYQTDSAHERPSDI